MSEVATATDDEFAGLSAKETIMGCCIHIVRADQAVTEQEKANINLIKDGLGI